MANYQLIFRNGPKRGSTVSIGEDRVVIGRSKDCQLVLGTPDVSRKHCMVVCNSEGVYARDLSSRNGTKVNGRDIADVKAVKLKHRDKLQVGKWKFRLIELTGSSVAKQLANSQDPQAGSIESPDTDGRLQTDVLNELDAIAASLDISVEDIPLTRGAATLEQSEGPQDAGDINSGDRDSGDDDQSGKATLDAPASNADDQPESPQQESVEPTKEIGDEKSEEGDEGDPPEMNRLPEHLRPKNPVDSQDAAEKALRRMFGA